jgi:tetratricopeptide (TPR) repeat protein
MAIEGAMAKEPDGRWARAEEMSEQLAEAPLRSATRRRRAIAHGLGIYAHSKAAKDEATIRVRLPKVAPPEQASRGAPDLGESASPAAGPSPTESPRRAKLLLAIVAVLVLGVATLLALNARSSVAPIASSAMAPRADAASALATPPEIAQLVRLADSSAATGSIGDMVDAIEDYERALSMGAPRQPVLGRLALTYAFLAEEGANRRGLNTRQVHAKAIALTDSAIRLPTPTTEAWLARATLRQLADDASPSEIRAAIRRASIANPSHPEARRLVALTPAFLGNIAEAETQLRAVTSASSVSPRAYRDLVQLLLAQGEFEAARTVADRGIKAYPRMGALYPLRARATTALGELRAAWADAETGALLGEHAAAAALYVLLDARAGELTSARVRARALVPRRVASRPPAMPPTQTVPFATAFVAVGDSATALDLLQRSSPKGARFCLELRSPELHPLRGDPRFRRIAQECASGTR